MIPQKILVTLLTASAVALMLGFRSPSSEAAATRTDIVASPADTTVTSQLNLTVGDRVAFEFIIINNSKKRVELRFPNGQTHDFFVLDSLGREVWRWSSGRMFTQVLQNKLLDANQVIAFQDTWKNTNASGTFL